MLLVVDANILFSAAIKDSLTAKILVSEDVRLITPEYVLLEFKEHEREILKKTHRTADDYMRFLTLIEDKIEIIASTELKKHMAEAKKTSPDPDDIPYFAAAIKHDCPIWSNDKRLKRQKHVKVHNTQDLWEKIGG